MKKKQIITISSCAVGGILFLGAGFMLYRSLVRYQEQDEKLTQLQRQLDQIYAADVFPSDENIEQIRQNTEQVDRWFNLLAETMAEGNINHDERSPSRFVGLLDRVRGRLSEQATEKNIELALTETGAFAFGFERYTNTGRLPTPDDVPRLVDQLMIVNRLGRIVFGSNIDRLLLIEREVFEDAAQQVAPVQPEPTRRGNRRRPSNREKARPEPAQRVPGVMSEGDWYATYRFSLEFEARESSLKAILNQFAVSKMYIVINSMELEKDIPDLLPAPRQAEQAPAAAAPVANDFASLFGGGDAAPNPLDSPATVTTNVEPSGPSAPVSGEDMELPMQVKMTLTVYKFREGLDEARN